MDAVLAAAIRETVRLQKHARSCRSALRALQDYVGRELGTYTLAAGERVDASEITEFLTLAVGAHADQEVRITVTAPAAGGDPTNPQPISRGKGDQA